MIVGSPEMSAATKEILGKVRQMVPPMLEKFHKGTWPSIIAKIVCIQTNAFFQVSWAVLRSLEAVRITQEPRTFLRWPVQGWAVIWYVYGLEIVDLSLRVAWPTLWL